MKDFDLKKYLTENKLNEAVEAEEAPKSNKMKKSELKEMIRQAMLAETEVFEAEGDTEEVDVEADAEEAPAEDTETTDVTVDDTETMDTTTTAELDPNAKAVQDALTQAIEAAKALGDKKLADQIGNSITFFTRQHVVGKEQVAENVDLFSLRMLKNAGIKK